MGIPLIFGKYSDDHGHLLITALNEGVFNTKKYSRLKPKKKLSYQIYSGIHLLFYIIYASLNYIEDGGGGL